MLFDSGIGRETSVYDDAKRILFPPLQEWLDNEGRRIFGPRDANYQLCIMYTLKSQQESTSNAMCQTYSLLYSVLVEDDWDPGHIASWMKELDLTITQTVCAFFRSIWRRVTRASNTLTYMTRNANACRVVSQMSDNFLV